MPNNTKAEQLLASDRFMEYVHLVREIQGCLDKERQEKIDVLEKEINSKKEKNLEEKQHNIQNSLFD